MLKLRAGNEEPIVWLNNYVKELNRKNKEERIPIIIKKDPSKIIDKWKFKYIKEIYKKK